MRGARGTIAFTLVTLLGTSVVLADEPETSVPGPLIEASPPDRDSPEALIAEGIELRKRREDRLALATFERAWELGKLPRALAQIALAEQALGYWREAHEHLETALDQTDDPWISAHRATLEVALKEIASRLGAVEVSCNVDGAEVWVDGRLVGTTPLQQSLRVAAGKSVIRVAAKGHFDAVRQTQVDAESLARVHIVLTPIEGGGRESAVAPAVSQPPTAAPPLEPSGSPTASVSAARGEAASARDVLKYTTTGLAALGAAVGITGYVIREVNVKLYNDNERCDTVLGPPRSTECGSEFAAWRRGEVIAIAGSTAAGVFGLTALYLWWSEPDARSDSEGVACAVAVGAVTCGSTF